MLALCCDGLPMMALPIRYSCIADTTIIRSLLTLLHTRVPGTRHTATHCCGRQEGRQGYSVQTAYCCCCYRVTAVRTAAAAVTSTALSTSTDETMSTYIASTGRTMCNCHQRAQKQRNEEAEARADPRSNPALKTAAVAATFCTLPPTRYIQQTDFAALATAAGACNNKQMLVHRNKRCGGEQIWQETGKRQAASQSRPSITEFPSVNRLTDCPLQLEQYTTTKTVVYSEYITPDWGGFPSSIARRPSGCQYRTIRLRKALGATLPTPTFWHRRCPNCGDIEHGKSGQIYTPSSAVSLEKRLISVLKPLLIVWRKTKLDGKKLG